MEQRAWEQLGGFLSGSHCEGSPLSLCSSSSSSFSSSAPFPFFLLLRFKNFLPISKYVGVFHWFLQNHSFPSWSVLQKQLPLTSGLELYLVNGRPCSQIGRRETMLFGVIFAPDFLPDRWLWWLPRSCQMAIFYINSLWIAVTQQFPNVLFMGPV